MKGALIFHSLLLPSPCCIVSDQLTNTAPNIMHIPADIVDSRAHELKKKRIHKA